MKGYNPHHMSDRVFTVLRITLFTLLIAWGSYTLIRYLAVPVHMSVLLSEGGRQAVMDACPDGGVTCQGLNALLPFIVRTIGWMGPFAWYIGISIVAFLALVATGYKRTGRLTIRLRLTPLRVLLAFVASLWLFFTVIGAGSHNGQPYNRLYEPVPQVYTGAGEEGLFVLQENFQRLTDRGCLTRIGEIGNGVGAYDMSHLCMQTSFFTIVLPHVILVGYLLFVFLALGRFLLSLLSFSGRRPLIEATFSLALGACGLIVVLWLVALIGRLTGVPVYGQAAGWGILLVIPAALYRHSLYWLRSLRSREWTYERGLSAGALILGWLLISYFALNFLNVVRPFPIGWDDLGKYINQPRLLVSYGYMIPQLAAYQWEYITSLGFLLFGFESVFGATAAMMFNWMAGVLAVVSVYAFGRLYLGPLQGLLAALLYYAMPVVGHFSYADMKVDNAVFAMGAFSVLAVFLALFPPVSDDGETEEPDEEASPERRIDWRWMVLAGVLGAFAFTFKPTAVMVLMAAGTVLFGAGVHWSAFVGTAALAWAMYLFEGRFNLADIGTRVYGNPEAFSKPLILGAFIVAGAALTIYAGFRKPEAMRRTAIAAGVFIASFFVTIAPWLLHNNLSFGNAVPRLVFTASNNLTPSMVVGQGESDPVDYGQDIRRLPEELRVDQSQCVGTAKSEELDRYWGYGTGWSHYLTLPWRGVMDLDSAGYYVTEYPALLLFPLVLLLPFFWKRQGRWLRWLFAGTAFMVLQWIFFANGIPWYGLGMFMGIVLTLEALVFRAPDSRTKIAAGVFIAFSLMTAYSQRFWQFEQQGNLFEYPLGKVSYEAMRERTIPHYDDIREMIEARAAAMPERPYVYRIGTFIPYFIPKNLEVLPVADHQVDFFNCLYQEKDAALTLRRLQALGFNSIIFDTNTHTIEADPNGSLHQKVQEFVDFVNAPGLGMTLAVNDPGGGIAYILLP